MSRYEDFIRRKKQEYGSKFDDSDLDWHFVPFFNTGVKIKVDDPAFGVVTGRVGVTTGWRPVFLLMRRSNAMGSSVTLTKRTKIIAWDAGSGSKPRWESPSTLNRVWGVGSGKRCRR